jgi:hypothetical protein
MHIDVFLVMKNILDHEHIINMNNNFGSIHIIVINELAHVVHSSFNLENSFFVSHE